MYLNDFVNLYKNKKNIGQATRNIYPGECVSLFNRYAWEVLGVGVKDSVGDIAFGGGRTTFPGAKHFWLNFEKSDLPKWFDKVLYKKGMKIQVGDVFVENGNYGHIGMALGGYDNSGFDVIDQNGQTSKTVKVYKRTYKSYLFGFLRPKAEYLKKLYADLPEPIDKNVDVNQISCDGSKINCRVSGGLKADIIGYMTKGFYNVIRTAEADGYKWYEVESNKWCAQVSGVVYYPKENELEELKKENEMLKSIIDAATISSNKTSSVLESK